MNSKVKMILIWVVVIFLVYAVVKSPTQAADVVKSIWDVIRNAFLSIGDFFSALIGS